MLECGYQSRPCKGSARHVTLKTIIRKTCWLVDARADREAEVVRDVGLPELWAFPPTPPLVHNSAETVATRVVRVKHQPLDGPRLLVERYSKNGVSQIVTWAAQL